MQAAGVSPQAVAGGVVMMDVHAGVGAEVGAPVLVDAAAAAPMQPEEAAPAPGVAALFGVAPPKAPAPAGPEAVAVTPGPSLLQR